MIKQEYREQKLIGGENLMKVRSNMITLSPMHRSTGALLSDYRGYQCKGSAILISKNLILTCAHNIYHKQTRQELKNFKFYLAAHGQVQKYYEIQSWRYPTQYETTGLSKYDYAVMKLKENINMPILYKNYCQLMITCEKCKPSEQIRQIQLEIYGYPGKDNYYPKSKNGEIFEVYQYGLSKIGKVLNINPQTGKITHQISTLKGQSGCAIVSYGNIRAIHIGSGFGDDNGTGVKNLQFNLGRLITFDVIINLRMWCAELEANEFQINQSCICSHYKEYQSQQNLASASLLYKSAQQNYKQRNFIEALNKLTKCLTIQQKKAGKTSNQVALTLNSIGIIYNRQGNYSKSLEYQLRALKMNEELNKKNSSEGAQNLNNIGNSYFYLQNYSKAIEYYGECVKVCQKINIKNQIYAYSLSGIGSAHYYIKDYKSAAISFQKSLAAYESIGIYSNQCGIWLAQCYKALNQTVKMNEIMAKYQIKSSQI